MKTKLITTMIAGFGAVMMCMPMSAAPKAEAGKDAEVKNERLFQKGKKAVVDAAHVVADKSVEVYGKAKDGTVKVSKNIFQKTLQVL